MELTAAISANFESDPELQNQPVFDLDESLRALESDARLAVGSYAGMCVTLIVDGLPLVISAIDAEVTDADILASVTLPWAVLTECVFSGGIEFYATAPGAFVDFAADSAWKLGLPLEAFELDQHMSAPSAGSAMTGLGDMVQVNQAIGMLVGRGYAPDSARTELNRRARLAGITLPAAAASLARQRAIQLAG